MISRFKAVIDLSFGDSGKGITTDYLCSNAKGSTIVCRFNGGQQAGHTVVYNGLKHTFSNFGSGTLRGVPSYWSKYCTIDPMGILNEFKVLRSIGIDPELYIDLECPVTTPYDKNFNRYDVKNLHHGTCGVGFGATLERESKLYSLKFKDLFNKTILKIKLDCIKNYYGSKEDYEDFLKECDMITFLFKSKTFEDVTNQYFNIIFEGSQGVLLDQDIGFFPHVTRSNTGTQNLRKLLPEAILDTYLVIRAYQTRHGNGPMTNTSIDLSINAPEETNVDNRYQGTFRRSVLDLDLLKYANERGIDPINTSKTLVITCLDQIESYKLTLEGKLIEFPTEDSFVEFIRSTLGIDKVIRFRSNETPKGLL